MWSWLVFRLAAVIEWQGGLMVLPVVKFRGVFFHLKPKCKGRESFVHDTERQQAKALIQGACFLFSWDKFRSSPGLKQGSVPVL